MIRLIRKKLGMKILELRYPEEIISSRGFDVIKIYSFKNQNKKGWEKNKTSTMMIDLSEDLDSLKNNMKKKYRKHITTEKNKGIISYLSKNNMEFEDFYKTLYLKLCKDKKLKPFPKEYLKQGDLWVARKGKILLSGSIIFSDEEYATQSFNASQHVEYNGNRSAIWGAIKYYKEKGLNYFNFGGGFSDYKKRFGSSEKDAWIYMKYSSKKAKLLNDARKIIKKRLNK